MNCDKVRLEGIHLSINGNSILADVSLSIKRNEVTLISGESGSGKTSLLNVMNFLYRPDRGDIYYDGEKIDANDGGRIDGLRNMEIAYSHQELALIENITLLQNLELFADIKGAELREDALSYAGGLLNISHLFDKDISVMSGGERQRAAFSKLLLFSYPLILIDEPTNNLDANNINYIIQGIMDIKRQNASTIVIVSHSKDLVGVADTVYDMGDLNHEK
jgi:putative ABC transport system ATP-binding protein